MTLSGNKKCCPNCQNEYDALFDYLDSYVLSVNLLGKHAECIMEPYNHYGFSHAVSVSIYDENNFRSGKVSYFYIFLGSCGLCSDEFKGVFHISICELHGLNIRSVGQHLKARDFKWKKKRTGIWHKYEIKLNHQEDISYLLDIFRTCLP